MKRAAGQALGIDINAQAGQPFVLPSAAPQQLLAFGQEVLSSAHRALKREGQLPDATSSDGKQNPALGSVLRTITGLASRSKSSLPQLFWEGIQGAGRLQAGTIEANDPALFRRIKKAGP